MPMLNTLSAETNPKAGKKIEDWVYHNLVVEQTPGLEWEEKEKLIFRISWIHGSNLIPMDDSDVKLARKWALHKGKSLGDDKKLKATLRCALNSSSGLKFLRKDKISRVYQFVPEDNKDDSMENLDNVISMFFDGPVPERKRIPEIDDDWYIVPNNTTKSFNSTIESNLYANNHRAFNCHIKSNYFVNKIKRSFPVS